MQVQPEVPRRHSVKLPQLYKRAQRIVAEISEKKNSLKTLLQQVRHPRLDAIAALVQETLKHQEILDKLIDEVLLTQYEHANRHLFRVLLCELLFRKHSLPPGSKPVALILENEALLKKQLKDYQKTETFDHDQLVTIPRYVRVNTLKTTSHKVRKWLKQEGFKSVKCPKVSHEEYVNFLQTLEPGNMLKDRHVSDLLVFHPKEKAFFGHQLLTEKHIFLQDKASCLPPLILDPQPGSVVLDSCAAPGIKTCHLAALMENSGQLIAVDRCPKRGAVLQQMVDDAGVTCAQVISSDFTDLDPNEPPYSDVQFLMVDPSCSGSGMASRRLEQTEDSLDRLRPLATFQLAILSHALSFPSAVRVVYSTCSVFPEENEHVVSAALEAHGDRFRLAEALPSWPHRSPILPETIRCDTDRDLTNGFYVALFERTKPKKKKKHRAESDPKKLKLQQE